MSNVQVFVRIRPQDRSQGLSVVSTSDNTKNPTSVTVQAFQHTTTGRSYHFDRVFDSKASQQQVFHYVGMPIVDEVLKGYSCTIFAYGQTGTGKTYTMEGFPENPGIIFFALERLFASLRRENADFTMRVSHVELHNEELKDLLNAGGDVKIRLLDDGKRSVVIHGVTEKTISSLEEANALIMEGKSRKQVAQTLMNETSSRSHCIFTIVIKIKEIGEDGEAYVKTGKLNLVDLAGSENIQRSGAVDRRAREAGSINQSLLTLGRVINHLAENNRHIPYRESKLTRILQDSLGGRTKTCIIATISPAKVNLEETTSTLDYASRAKNIRNKPEINKKLTAGEQIFFYSKEIQNLKEDLRASQAKNGIYLDPVRYEELTTGAKEQKEKLEAQLQQLNEVLEQRNECIVHKDEEIRDRELQLADLERAVDHQIKRWEKEHAKCLSLTTALKQCQANLDVQTLNVDRLRNIQTTHEGKLKTLEQGLGDVRKSLIKQQAALETSLDGLLATRDTDMISMATSMYDWVKSVLVPRELRLQDQMQHLSKKVPGLFGPISESQQTLLKRLQDWSHFGSQLSSKLTRSVEDLHDRTSTNIAELDRLHKETFASLCQAMEEGTRATGLVVVELQNANKSSQETIYETLRNLGQGVASIGEEKEKLVSSVQDTRGAVSAAFASIRDTLTAELETLESVFAKMPEKLWTPVEKATSVVAESVRVLESHTKTHFELAKEKSESVTEELEKRTVMVTDQLSQSIPPMEKTVGEIKTCTAQAVENGEDIMDQLSKKSMTCRETAVAHPGAIENAKSKTISWFRALRDESFHSSKIIRPLPIYHGPELHDQVEALTSGTKHVLEELDGRISNLVVESQPYDGGIGEGGQKTVEPLRDDGETRRKRSLSGKIPPVDEVRSDGENVERAMLENVGLSEGAPPRLNALKRTTSCDLASRIPAPKGRRSSRREYPSDMDSDPVVPRESKRRRMRSGPGC